MPEELILPPSELPPTQPPPQPPDSDAAFRGKEPTTHVFSVIEYLDNAGRRVIHRKTLSGLCPTDFDEFVGLQTLMVMVNGMQPQPMPYRFPIGATTVDAAFDVWDDLATKFGKRHVAEVRRKIAEGPPPEQGLALPSLEEQRKVLAASKSRDNMSRGGLPPRGRRP